MGAQYARRMARFPPPGVSVNPYLALLDNGLTSLGVVVVPDPALSMWWLWQSRAAVELLHFHWRVDAHYACLGREVDEETVALPRLQGIRSWLKLTSFTCRLAFARALGYRVAWTIHEVYPNETGLRPAGAISRRLDRVAGRLLARFSNVVFAHEQGTARQAHAELGIKRVVVVPHGSYIDVYPSGRSRPDVRDELGIPDEAFVFLCFGDIRSDKALDLVVDAFRSTGGRNAVLVIAGRVKDESLRRRLVAVAERDRRIHLLFGLVPHHRVAELFGAADAAVLGRTEVWTSGSLILALSLGVPVVAARSSVHEELLGAETAGWLFDPADRESLGRALQAARANPTETDAKGAAALRVARQLPTWRELAELIAPLTLLTEETAEKGSRPRPWWHSRMPDLRPVARADRS
jgi:beta-1,4-mannosyltransferase